MAICGHRASVRRRREMILSSTQIRLIVICTSIAIGDIYLMVTELFFGLLEILLLFWW